MIEGYHIDKVMSLVLPTRERPPARPPARSPFSKGDKETESRTREDKRICNQLFALL